MPGDARYWLLNWGKYAVGGGFSGDGKGLTAPAYGFAKLLLALPSSERTVPNGA